MKSLGFSSPRNCIFFLKKVNFYRAKTNKKKIKDSKHWTIPKEIPTEKLVKISFQLEEYILNPPRTKEFVDQSIIIIIIIILILI